MERIISFTYLLKMLPLICIMVLSTFCISCQEDDLAFEVIESPVLALFETLESDETTLSVEATFYELDKSGILDYNIGIDSTLISGLPIEVFINETQLIGSFVTDGNGAVIFEAPKSELIGAFRLEWTGTHDDTPFRIYQNF